MWWLVVLLVLFLVIVIVRDLKINNDLKKNNLPTLQIGKTVSPVLTKEPDESETAPEAEQKQFRYEKKGFLTPVEKKFLQTLKALNDYNLIIIPQVNLATIIQKIGDFRYQNELYRNIDFGVFDSEYNLLLLIELNDSSHRQYQRQQRDLKVNDIVSGAGIKLMKFYTDKPNNQDYVIGRILGELGIAK